MLRQTLRASVARWRRASTACWLRRSHQQAHHQAVDGHSLQSVGFMLGFNASRMRCTAATELALSPCTHRVLACSTRGLPSLATNGSPREMVRACWMIVSGVVVHGAGQLAGNQVAAAVVGTVGEGFEPQGHTILIAQGLGRRRRRGWPAASAAGRRTPPRPGSLHAIAQGRPSCRCTSRRGV